MSQMACRCGNVIRDNVIPCSTEARVLRDQDQELFDEAVCRAIAAFFAAARTGRRAEWVNTYFSPKYPTDESDEQIVSDILHSYEQLVHLSVAECFQCGRLWLQREPGVNSYRSYAPDEPGYAGALRSPAAGQD